MSECGTDWWWNLKCMRLAGGTHPIATRWVRLNSLNSVITATLFAKTLSGLLWKVVHQPIVWHQLCTLRTELKWMWLAEWSSQPAAELTGLVVGCRLAASRSVSQTADLLIFTASQPSRSGKKTKNIQRATVVWRKMTCWCQGSEVRMRRQQVIWLFESESAASTTFCLSCSAERLWSEHQDSPCAPQLSRDCHYWIRVGCRAVGSDRRCHLVARATSEPVWGKRKTTTQLFFKTVICVHIHCYATRWNLVKPSTHLLLKPSTNSKVQKSMYLVYSTEHVGIVCIFDAKLRVFFVNPLQAVTEYDQTLGFLLCDALAGLYCSCLLPLVFSKSLPAENFLWVMFISEMRSVCIEIAPVLAC